MAGKRRRNKRRSPSAFGVRRNRRHARARRNAWKESRVAHTFAGMHKGKKVSFVVKKAVGHHAAAKKGWAGRTGTKKKAAPKVQIVVAAATPKRAKPKRKTKSSAPRKSRGKTKAKARRNRGRRYSARPRRNRRRRSTRFVVVAPRRNRRKARRNRSHKRSHSRRNRGRRYTRRNRRRARRNDANGGIMNWLPKIAVAGAALGLAALGGSKLSAMIADKLPASVKEYAPALATGAVAAGLYMAAKRWNLIPEKFMNALLYGGAGAAVVQLFTHLRINTSVGQQSIAQYVGLPWASALTAAPAPVQSEAALGTQTAKAVAGLGNYGVFGLGGMNGVINVDGRPLAVEGYDPVAGLLNVPGAGPLVVEGMGDFVMQGMGDVFSDSVLGTQSASSGPAENPFAPGLRGGDRGTHHEMHVQEIGPGSSLSGNIFS